LDNIDVTGQDLKAEEIAKKTVAELTKANARIVMREFEKAKKKWLKTKIPTKDNLAEIKKTAIEFRIKIPQLQNQQPKCWINPDYEKVFSYYKKQVEETLMENRHALTLLKGFSMAKVDRRRRDIQSKIDHLTNLKNKNQKLLNSAQRSRASSIIKFLQTKKETLKQLTKKEIKHAEQLVPQLKNYATKLNQLKKSTHQFHVIKTSTVTVNPARRANPDSSLKDRPQKTKTFPSQWKCTKCGRETKKPPL
jgi:rubrerythrin